MKRRSFISRGGLLSLPLLTGLSPLSLANPTTKPSEDLGINLILEGHFLNPKQYIQKLSEIEAKSGINGDFYSTGGVVTELEDKFKTITGKEAAIYMPSGTMANELALRILCGNKTKAIVHADSHIYRDEGDSAQAIHSKRLVPIESKKHSFTLADFKAKLQELENGESFYDGVGALSIESPVRRHHGKLFAYDQMKAITDYARQKGIEPHLDGARIHIAAAYSGISVKQYSELFDTVYISLYKYLGAAGGAILCGDEAIISQMQHWMKILGGTVFRSWTHAAVANHFLDGLEGRLKETVEQSNELISQLKQLDELQINTVENGTNILFMESKKIDMEKFAEEVNDTYGIWMNYPDDGIIQVHLNESIRLKTNQQLLEAFKSGIQRGRN
ncbi:MAG: aminotransferase class I/II-fold pyridoxal phosphate-dependent enzyme [Bacteroidota bacterium]